MHRLLQRQIRRHFSADAPNSSEWEAFLQAVSAAYEQSDADRVMLERSLELSSHELFERNRLLEEASRAKSAFLANMSHEIRTPMTAIIGYAEMLLETRQSPVERHDCLRVIERNAKHLLALINDILDVSKIEAGAMKVENIPVELSQIIYDVVSMMRPRALEKALRFECTAAGPVPKTIQSDPVRLKQILTNIVGNAIKFTERGEVCVLISCESKPDGSLMRFEVRDSGIGMSADQVARLFQPFMQADDSMTRRFGGTGLGLNISKKLAQLLGGDITVTSEAAAGSTFSVTIAGGPLTNVPMLGSIEEKVVAEVKPPTRDASTIRLRGRILLAEDGIDNQRLINAVLKKAGADVVVVENGRLAVERVQSEEFDLIVMDMQMPEMDGYTATRLLRNQGFALPIVALTAHAMADDREKCLEAGCTDYLTKPVDKRTLIQALAGYLNCLNPQIAENPSSNQQVITATGLGPAPAVPQSVRSEFADDPEMKELVHEFTGSLPVRVAELRQLLERKNLEDLRRLLHQLKGSGGGYGFAGVSVLAAEAEQSIKTQDSLENIAANVQSLVSLVRSIIGYDSRAENLVSGPKP